MASNPRVPCARRAVRTARTCCERNQDGEIRDESTVLEHIADKHTGFSNRIRDLKHELRRLRHVINVIEKGESDDSDRHRVKDHLIGTSSAAPDTDYQSTSRDGDSPAEFGVATITPAAKEVGSNQWALDGDDETAASCGPMGVYSFCPVADIAPPPHGTNDAPTAQNKSLDMDLDLSHLDHMFQAEAFYHYYAIANRYNRFLDPTAPLALASQHDLDQVQFLKGAVLATGAALSNDPDISRIGLDLAAKISSLALSQCMKTPSNEVIIGLSILAWLEISKGNDLRGWMFNSMACSLVSHRGLHVLAPLNGTETPEEVCKYQASLRTFWTSCYIDRTASAALGRLPTTQWRHVQTASYCSIFQTEDIALEDLYFGQICSLWRLFDTIMDEIYAPTLHTKSASTRINLLKTSRCSLFQFHDQSPTRLRLGRANLDDPFCGFYYNIAYQTSLILLCRPFLSDSDEQFRIALRTMVTAAFTVCDIVQQHRRKRSFAQAPPFVAYHLTRSSIVFLLLATSTADAIRLQAGSRLKNCLEALEECGRTWPKVSGKSIRLVQGLASRWGVVRTLPMRFSNAPSVVRSLEKSVSEEYSVNQADPLEDNENWEFFETNSALWTDMFEVDFSWLANESSWNFDNTFL